MKVNELIEILKGLDQDEEIYTYDSQEGIFEIDGVERKEIAGGKYVITP